MKFNPRTHIVGKVYDLSQDNMNAMIARIEMQEQALEDALTFVPQIEVARIRKALESGGSK